MNTKKIIIACLCLIMIVSATSFVYAATYELFPGGFASAKNLTWNTSNGQYSSEASTAIAQWSRIDSNVSFVKSSELLDHELTISPGVINSTTANNLGMTTFYRNGTQISPTMIVNANVVWDKAVCVRYNSDLLDTFEKKTATTTHEIGHALSLAHCADQNACIAKGEYHIMHQTIKTSYVPTAYDIAILKYKW